MIIMTLDDDERPVFQSKLLSNKHSLFNLTCERDLIVYDDLILVVEYYSYEQYGYSYVLNEKTEKRLLYV